MNSLTKNSTLNICVLGNSHAGSLKLGWNLIEQDYPGIKITFFAARACGLEQLSVRKGMLVPTNAHLKKSLSHTSGGHEAIDLSLFDICLIYGLRFSFPYKLEIGRTTHYLSKAAYECSIHDTISSALSIQVLKKVRCLSKIPVYIGHNPLTARNRNSFLKEAISYPEFVAAVNRILIADQAVLLAQPEETITENIYTKAEYKSGAVCLDVGDKSANQPYASEDNVHMNDEFGRIYLQHFIQQIPMSAVRQDYGPN